MPECNKESYEVPVQDSRSNFEKLNPGPLECKAGVLIVTECHYVLEHISQVDRQFRAI